MADERSKGITDAFDLLIPPSFLQEICDKTNDYNKQKKKKIATVTVAELKMVIGFTLLDGINSKQVLSTFWEEVTMNKKRFDEILSCIHFSGTKESLTESWDKGRKIVPLIHMIIENFQINYTPKSRTVSLQKMKLRFPNKYGLKQHDKLRVITACETEPPMRGYFWKVRGRGGHWVYFCKVSK